MKDWIELDSVRVVSDLHLGGESGFQIFGSASELAWLIDQVSNDERPGWHGLIINGDFIDFLAELPSMQFDPHGATNKIDSVWRRFLPVFEALQRLVSTPQRRLIINLGNHDLELALPWVRAHLSRRLSRGNEVAQSRLTLITDGTGVRCLVGGLRVVCLHGNEVDSWNVADYERLRRISRDLQLGLPCEPWTPNAGTQLVIEVMNEVKREYPFVDLLKPETAAVLPILAALNPKLHRRLVELAGVAGRRAWDIARLRAGFLDADAPLQAYDRTFEASPMFPMGATSGGSPALLNEVESAWRQGLTPMALVRGSQDQQLGFWSATRDFVAGRPRQEVLREALEHLDQDRSFEPDEPDVCFHELDEMVGADIEIVVAGHTHLERSLPRRRGKGHYFNTGTWARLMRIDPALRSNAASFEKLFRLLDGGSMEMLDQAHYGEVGDIHDLVIRRNTVLVIDTLAGQPKSLVRAALHHVLPALGAVPSKLSEPVGDVWMGG